MAIANHGGGIIIIGYKWDKDKGMYIEEKINEEDLKNWEQTKLHDLLTRYMEPVPEVQLLFVKGGSSVHPVVKVSSHDRTPIICIRDSKVTRKGAIYIRKPGPKSEEPHSESEWQDLIKRCLLADKEDLMSTIRSILNPPESAVKNATQEFYELISFADHRFKRNVSNYTSLREEKFGRWIIAYQLLPVPRAKSLKELYSALQSAQVGTGWSIGIILDIEEHKPKPRGDFLEAWIYTTIFDHRHLDYWLAKPTGFFYHTRGFTEDFEIGRKDILEWIWPIWGVSEGLIHALKFAREYDDVDSIRFYCRYEGILGRKLWNSNSRIVGPLRNYICRIDSWSGEIEVPISIDLVNIPDLVADLLDPFYENFDLFEMPKEGYHREFNEFIKQAKYLL